MTDLGEILIVDDSRTSQLIIQSCLEMAGFTMSACHHAGDGLEAIAVLNEHPRTNLVITDLNMPKMDGKSLVRLLRTMTATAKIRLVVVSSMALSSCQAELLELGVQAVVMKPLSPEKMARALDPREGAGCHD